MTLSDGTQLVAVLTETSRIAGKDAAEGLAAYSVLILNNSGGDVPAGLEFSFGGTSINGSNLMAQLAHWLCQRPMTPSSRKSGEKSLVL